MSVTEAPPGNATRPVPGAALSRVGLPFHGIDEATLADIADTAPDVDHAATDLRPRLRRLASQGRIDLGLPDSAGTLVEQVSVIERIAEDCVVSAFTLWAQRMAAHYLVAEGGPQSAEFASLLRSAERPGVTAMAAAFRDVSGSAPMPITFRRDGDDLILDGPISWASNLHDDALIVTVARDALVSDPATGDRLVVVVPMETPGVSMRPADQLLALDSSRSGSLEFTGVRVPSANIVGENVAAFVRAVQPTFLLLQSALCLGLSTRSLAATPPPAGLGTSFNPERARLQDEHHRIAATLVNLARHVNDHDISPTRDYLQLRLDAAILAGDATRLELCLTGGRGYLATSSTARRIRESLFLPIQSPTESELRWELSRFN